MPPFFSLIIPTLNEEKYIGILLGSILKQKEKSFEVILVDASSRDNTFKIANKLRNQFVKKHISFTILISKKHNISHQRNQGAEIAKGKYLTFFDADVTIPRDYLSQIKKTLIATKSLLLATWIDPETEVLADKIITLTVNFLIELGKEVGKPMLLGYDITINKELFNKIGKFREDIKIGEDVELAERAFKHNVTAYVLRKPTIVHSSRRYRKNGYFKTTYTYLTAAAHVLIKGHITKNIFDYPMGGKAHEK